MRAPDFALPFVFAVDASRVGAWTVRLQKEKDQAEHLVTYFSKKLTPAQRNYCVDQELLVILLALQHFEMYLPSHGPVIDLF